jgi:hypothetical protein
MEEGQLTLRLGMILLREREEREKKARKGSERSVIYIWNLSPL